MSQTELVPSPHHNVPHAGCHGEAHRRVGVVSTVDLKDICDITGGGWGRKTLKSDVYSSRQKSVDFYTLKTVAERGAKIFHCI